MIRGNQTDLRSSVLVQPRTPPYNRQRLTQNAAAPEPPNQDPSAAVLALVIAIDGPVASGKTAVGLQLSRELNYRLVDTGMMYRAVTCLALQEGADLEDEAKLAELAQSATIDLEQPDQYGLTAISINGTDVTAQLRQPPVDRGVSFVSRVPGVRQAMVTRQRGLAAEGRLIMLGRDIGGVVLPDAPLKVYLDASPKERAHRRHLELAEAGAFRPEAEILEELEQRDEMDRKRDVSPLKPAPGALIINTDDLTLEEVVARVRAAASAQK